MKMIRRAKRNDFTRRTEQLEPRALLDATGFLWGDAPQLTLSFAQEGTSVAGLSSALHGTFDGLADSQVWQGTVLRAFQSWASLTNGDIGVVADNGLPFGVPGFARDDARFGDVRIAAVPLAEDVLAVSIPASTLVAGSWSGDVLLNSTVAWTSLDDLFSVVLHEAGHVFGLEHSDDPASPMHVHGISSATIPTPTDVAALTDLHGTRMPDLNEYDSSGNDGTPQGMLVGNDSLDTATRLQTAQDGQGADGSAPSIAHGDITSPGDVDYFWWDGLSGPVTITVRPAGISLLAPDVALLDEQGAVLQSVVSSSNSGESVTLHLTENDRHAVFFLRVAGAPGPFAIGHYSATVSFDDLVTVDPARSERFAGREFRFATAHQIRDLFEDSANSLFNDDAHADDDPLEAGELDTAIGFADDTRYEAIGSIADALDVDHYRFKSPLFPAAQTVPLTLVVTALESDRLIPQVKLFTADEVPVVTTTVANGNGQLVLQLPEAIADDEYLLRVAAIDGHGAHATGNYRLTIIFGGQPVELVDFAQGTLTADVPLQLHGLYVGQSQLLHLLLDASAATSLNSGVWMTVYRADGAVRGRVGALAGDARSGGPMLLEPGTYTVQVSGIALDGTGLDDMPYRLRGVTLSDPLGPILHDPTNEPVFQCPDQPDMFCYPGGVQSPSPFLWTDFILSEPSGQPPSDPNALFNDWWNWFWSLQPGDTNGDQAVDLADLNNVRNHFGESGAAPLGDTDGDGNVNLEDLNRVRNNFGVGDSAPLPQSAPAAAPPAPAGWDGFTKTAPTLHSQAADALFSSHAAEAGVFGPRRRLRHG